jgi:hypothetical protein
MAEATDRSSSPGQIPPNAGVSGEEQGAIAPVSSDTYQPLSLLALASFGLALLYALVVLILGAVALLGRNPFLMPGWTFLFPIAVLILCWAARMRIRNSEGTLSGLTFTAWGSRLAVLFGLIYGAYYSFTFIAVRLQAMQFADRFFEQIKQGHLDKAFLLAQGENPNSSRDLLELRFNQSTPTPGGTGFFTRFCQERFVRFIEMDGEQAKIIPRGVAAWDYSKGGYRMTLNYHVSTSLVDFDMKLETFGRDPKADEPKGPKWQILLTGGETAIVGDLRPTPQGQDFMRKTGKAHDFATEWVAKIDDPSALKPSERKQLSELIRLDDKTFWAGQKQREDIKNHVRNTFQPAPAGRPSFNLTLQPPSSALPLLSESGGQTIAKFDVTLNYFDDSGSKILYIVNGRLVVSAPSSAAADSASAWKVEGIDIESGRTPPERRRPPDPRSGGSPRPQSP